MTPDDLPERSYYRSLDGLRGVAALMVVYGHAGYFGWVPLVVGCATIGVILFFFLSGFLMGHHYLPDTSSGVVNRRALAYWVAFLFRRFTRVYPPYLLAPVVGYLLLMPLMPPDFKQAKAFADLSIVDELVRIATFKGELGIYWTIEVELFFYLLYPFIIVLCLLTRKRAATLFLIFVGLTAFKNLPPELGGVPWEAGMLGQWPGFTSIFVAGAFTAVMAKRNPNLLNNRLLNRNALTLVSVLALILVVALVSHSGPTQKSIWQLQWLFAALFFIMFMSLVRSDGAVSRLLSSPAFIRLGRSSYSLYLIHLIAFYIFIEHLARRNLAIPTAAVVLVILTSLYYAVVERPFVRLSKQIKVGDRAAGIRLHN